MQIVRLITITFGSLSDPYKRWTFEIDNLKVTTIGFQEQDKSSLMLVKCQRDCTGGLKVNESNEITVPPEIVLQMDRAIESAANLVSVLQQTKRVLRAAMPPVAFIPESDQERKWLDSTRGFNPLGGHFFGVKYNLDIELQSALLDRPDGVALMAEANAQEHPAGIFHELIRVFERAFALTSTELVNPLSTFLENSGQGYSEDEIRNWLVEIRHPATHADRRDFYVVERGLRPLVRRMTQAAYDVLLNKLDWRSTSTSRRDIWKPEGGTAAPGGSTIFLTKRLTTFEATVMDAFNTYPVNLEIGIKNFIQNDWWIKLTNDPGRVADTANGS